MRWLALATAAFALSSSLAAQATAPKQSRADTLRGSFTTPGRRWWDVTFYDLHVAVQPNDSSIAGYNGITYRVLEPASEMQIDLMEPLVVDSMTQDGQKVRYRREGAAWFDRPARTSDRSARRR